ncbi:hypothetical protein AgCh_017914 [Apium graveolens]
MGRYDYTLGSRGQPLGTFASASFAVNSPYFIDKNITFKVKYNAVEPLADPEEYLNLFGDWQVALGVESKVADTRFMRCFCNKGVVQGAVDVNIGANPSAEGGGEDEGVDDQAQKVVDIIFGH